MRKREAKRKMIYDIVENASQYAIINRGINKILETAKSFTKDNFPKERLALDGESLFMNFAEYTTHCEIGHPSEAHRKYIDVMYMVDGNETVYVKPTSQLKKIRSDYDPEIEALLADTDDDAIPVRLSSGMFLILFPGDAHTPGCDPLPERGVNVKKIIGKVLIGN